MADAAAFMSDRPCTADIAPELRAAGPADAAGIHELLRGALRDTPADPWEWRARWAWQGWENPYRQDRPVGWVLVEGDRVVGHVGAVYVPLRVGGQRRLGVIVSDYCVAPDAAARNGVLLGLSLAQEFFDSAKATECIPWAASANEKTGAVFARYGCRPVPWTREFYRVPADLPAEIRACLGGRSRVIRSLQTGRLAALVDRFLRSAYAGLRRRPRMLMPAGCRLEESADIADWTEVLGRLDEVCASDEFSIERSADYLAWRYVRHPRFEDIRLLALRHKGGELLAAAIVRRDQRPDRRAAVVEDIIAPVDRPEMVKSLLCAALRWATDCRLEYLTTMGGRLGYRPVYWELGFQTRARSAPAALVPRSILESGGEVEFWQGAMF